MFRPPKCHILSFKTVVGYLCKFHVVKDGTLAPKIEGKTNFSRRLTLSGTGIFECSEIIAVGCNVLIVEAIRLQAMWEAGA